LSRDNIWREGGLIVERERGLWHEHPFGTVVLGLCKSCTETPV
jgi:hypothetical protein